MRLTPLRDLRIGALKACGLARLGASSLYPQTVAIAAATE
jgi:hypothetical protein